jgi:hypothetical protein
MSKENMQFGEGFAAKVLSKDQPTPPDGPQTRHYVIGWSVITAMLGAAAWLLVPTAPVQKPSVLPLRAKRVRASGTTATNLIGLA